jgi:hypothetical protein
VLHVQNNDARDVVDFPGQGRVEFDVTDVYQTLACQGCETVCLAHFNYTSEDIDPNEGPPGPTLYPKTPIGRPLPQQHLPPDIHSIYEEARRAAGGGSPTGAVMLCRGLLTHIAVGEGAPPKGTFEAHVDWLLEKGYLPPRSKTWVDQIRVAGNAVNHKLHVATREEAYRLLQLVELILRAVHVAPAQMHEAVPSWELPPR